MRNAWSFTHKMFWRILALKVVRKNKFVCLSNGMSQLSGIFILLMIHPFYIEFEHLDPNTKHERNIVQEINNLIDTCNKCAKY